MQFAFELCRLDAKKRKYILCCTSEQEKEEWMTEIQKCIDYYLTKMREGDEGTFRGRQNTIAGVCVCVCVCGNLSSTLYQRVISLYPSPLFAISHTSHHAHPCYIELSHTLSPHFAIPTQTSLLPTCQESRVPTLSFRASGLCPAQRESEVHTNPHHNTYHSRARAKHKA